VAQEALLLPVESYGAATEVAATAEPLVAAAAAEPLVAAEVAAEAVAENVLVDHDTADHLKGHKYRLQSINPSRCRGRKVAEKTPIPGTETSHAQSNGKFFPELQCIKKVTEGTLLCETCCAKYAEYKADTSNSPKGWFGRLDEPMYPKALVVGSHHFFTKYPQGLPDDPSTAAPPEWLKANSTVKAKTSKATVSKATKPKADKPKADNAETKAETKAEAEAKVEVAATEAKADSENEWIVTLIDCRSHVYEKASGKCYLAKTDKSYTNLKELADMDHFEGIYNPETETLNVYGCEDDE
jgi:hypothetical protein